LDVNNAASGKCSSGSCTSCGHVGQVCCNAISGCVGRTICSGDSHCAACGALGTPCCPGTQPCGDPNLLCVNQTQTCTHCGGPGEPCCNGNLCTNGCCVSPGGAGQLCIPPGAACPGMDGTCAGDGSCSNCGREGQSCCDNQTCSGDRRCGPKAVCTSKCGGPGEPCCTGHACAAGCCATQGDIDFCIDVGELCPGQAGTCAADGSCGTCGGLGEPCCPKLPNGPPQVAYCSASLTSCLGRLMSLEIDQLLCRACGQRGLPCCEGQCQSPAQCDGIQCI